MQAKNVEIQDVDAMKLVYRCVASLLILGLNGFRSRVTQHEVDLASELSASLANKIFSPSKGSR